jgi:hypothetical protein
MRLWMVVFLCAIAIGCSGQRQGATPDNPAAWKETADQFMADLIAKRTDKAIEKMEPEFIAAVGDKEKAKLAVEKLFDYCGRPLDSEFRHEERGFKLYVTGRKKEMRKFFYSSKTNQHPKGVCFFAVEVVQADDDSAYKVTTFGPLKLLSGNLPDWAR